jgi:hypothetical protein
VQGIGADKILFATDYPHFDSGGNAVGKFLENPGIAPADQRGILADNAVAFFGVTLPAATRPSPPTPGGCASRRRITLSVRRIGHCVFSNIRHVNCVGKNCLQVALNLYGTLKKYCRTMGWSVNAKFTTSNL